MFRKYRWVLVSAAIVFFTAGAVYGVLDYYFSQGPVLPQPPIEQERSISANETNSEESHQSTPEAATQTATREEDPGASESLYVGIDSGQITVFYGSPTNGKIKEHTGITTDGVPQYELKRLESGVAVDSEEDLAVFLEGLGES